MRQRLHNAVAMAVALVLGSTAAQASDRPDWKWLVVCDGPNAEAERAAVVKALELLPRLPARVAVMDVTEAQPDVRAALLRLDAFVTQGSPVVYVVQQSSLLKGAIQGSTPHMHALATVIWHEMAHAEGADEREARKREEQLWTTFVRDQRVDGVVALRYLKALNERPDDLVVALR
jgi:hypothetical protein